MNDIKLSKRLSTAASYVRSGAFVADIGTDHAFLPIYLVLSGKVDKALASDINVGPIQTAKENITRYGLTDKIFTEIANGLEGIESYCPTDIVICGMGGELIADIVEKADFVKNPAIRLVLLPMTKVGHLREYLANNGFAVEGETLSSVQNKVYTCLCVSYTGQPYSLTAFEREFGCFAPKAASPAPELLVQMQKKKRDLSHRIQGGLAKGEDVTQAKQLAEEIERYLCEHS